ncbi:MAG: glucosaminidase domain-containing protein [Chitinophagales bacterium]|jgi:LysM repeat protein|nr:glucosaminidase domain-containing protein [Sphingobacteriales bacterium]MBP7534904.1 glucosaminidase domain-containing protein [Chitinophagales bacterium]
MFKSKPICLLVFILFGNLLVIANNTKNSSSSFLAYSYLAKYKSIAINEMKRTGIPASITLAQGMYESGFGKSELALKGNNHFGIKCKSNWVGAKMYYTDDEPDECFRKYSTPNDSYRDHSNFLVEREHYQSLFNLPPTDYKGWAIGLKKAGYATDPNYSSKIIAIIQRFKLYEYDYSSYPQEEIETAPIDDTYIYANDGIFASTLGTPRITNQLSNLQRIDIILQQTIEERPMEIAPRSLSGSPVIDVNPDQIKGTIQTPITLKAATNQPNLNNQTAAINQQPTQTQIPVLNNQPQYQQNPKTPAIQPTPEPPNQQPQTTTANNNQTTTNNQIIPNNEADWVNKTKVVRYNYTIKPTEVAQHYKLSVNDLLFYNDLTNAQTNIEAGVNIYLEPKKNRYIGTEKLHIVQNNQNMWDIAQQYGLLLADLYKRNAMRETTQPLVGEQILLKGKANYPPKVKYERQQPNTNLVNTPTTAPAPSSSTNAIFRRTTLDSNNALVYETIAQQPKLPIAKNNPPKVQYHTVKTGDTLKNIAQQYNTTEEKLKSANNLSNNTKTKSGDILLIIQ